VLLFFGITVALAGQVFDLPRAGGADRRPRLRAVSAAPLIAAVALFAQTVLGAAVRHHIANPIAHIAGAAVATALVMWAGLSTLMTHMDEPVLRRPAFALLSLTFSQVFLGIAAYMARAATIDAPQPMPLMVWITVAHVAVGSLAFGAAIALAMATQAWRPAMLNQGVATV
jgi:heme A synthase